MLAYYRDHATLYNRKTEIDLALTIDLLSPASTFGDMLVLRTSSRSAWRLFWRCFWPHAFTNTMCTQIQWHDQIHIPACAHVCMEMTIYSNWIPHHKTYTLAACGWVACVYCTAHKWASYPHCSKCCTYNTLSNLSEQIARHSKF